MLCNGRLYCYASCYKICHAFGEMLRCFVIINKTHEPEIMPIHCDSLDISFRWIFIFRWIFPHDYRVDCTDFAQRYHDLFQVNMSIRKTKNLFVVSVCG